MKTALFAGLAAAAMVAVAPAFAQIAPAPIATPVPPRAPIMREQMRSDVVAKVRAHFARIDGNRDGFVTKAEADAVRGQMRAQFAANRGERSENRREATQMRREHRFERVDTNNDGVISRAEYDVAHAQRDGMAMRRQGKRMATGMRRIHMMGGGFGGRMFEMADVNKDGRVSIQEAQDAALRRFDMADANRDGRVTRDERLQRVRQVRIERRPG